MSDIRVASRYAKSLIELAKEQGALEAVHADMELFVSVCQQNRELVGMLKSPIVRGDQKRQILEKAFGGFHALSRLFVDTVVKKGREAFLPLIAKEFNEMYNELNNVASAVVTTATKLDADALAEIRQVLESRTGKKIDMTTQIDPSLIGGFVVRMDDKLYDASIVNKLRKIKKELVLN